MDTMQQHPWTELQVLIKEKWLTQKAFASILWKKISEVNELLKWKRNITIQRDYLLHQALWTPMKYWIMKQIDYEYSLLDIEESEHQTRHSEALAEESSTNNLTSLDSSTSLRSSLNDNTEVILTNNEESASNWEQDNFKQQENIETNNSPSDTKNLQNNDELDNENWQKNNDEDFKERAQIFKSF